MSTTNNVNLNFKYGEGELPDITSGSIYIKKIVDATATANGRARIYIDSPETNPNRLEIGGGDVYVGKSTDPAAKSYDVIIDPNGEAIDNVVTSVQPGGFQLKIEKAEGNIDTYQPSIEGLSGNTIIFVIE